MPDLTNLIADMKAERHYRDNPPKFRRNDAVCAGAVIAKTNVPHIQRFPRLRHVAWRHGLVLRRSMRACEMVAGWQRLVTLEDAFDILG